MAAGNGGWSLVFDKKREKRNRRRKLKEDGFSSRDSGECLIERLISSIQKNRLGDTADILQKVDTDECPRLYCYCTTYHMCELLSEFGVIPTCEDMKIRLVKDYFHK